MPFLLPLIFAGLIAQQPETLSLLKEPLFAPSVSKADRARLDTEIAEAQAVLKREPSNVDAILRLARAEREFGRVGDSLEALTRAIETHPDEARLTLDRGRGFVLIRKFDVALRDFRKAAETLPDAHCDIAFVSYLLADYAVSHEEFGKCHPPSTAPSMFPALAAVRAGKTPAAGVPPPAPPAHGDLAPAYATAVAQLVAHKTSEARDLLKPLVEKNKDRWMEPVYIAAEADYARIAKAKKSKKGR